jgi:hypothetical protein
MTTVAHPRYGRLLHEHRIAAVGDEFRRVAPELFGDDLVFGFLCGGFAKGYATESHDADFFVCVRALPSGAFERYRRWYVDLHHRRGIAPDERDPGEVVLLSSLEEKIGWVSTRHVRPEIPTYYEYEAIVWADMLSGPKIAKVGDLHRLAVLERQVEVLPQRWRSDILRDAGADAETLWTLPLTLLFEQRVRYTKRR